tara:strand:- start:114 stop:953 length:840 start_codon:yes stop_codon:yes gene_type:complete
MKKVILLTGATGFVGKNILTQLMQQGFSVRLVIRKGKEHLIPKSDLIESMVICEDLFEESESFWEKACLNIDTFIHCAWYAEPGKYQVSKKNFDCLKGTYEIIKGATKAKIKKFVGIGSCAEYEISKNPITVNTPLNPKTPYAACKASTFLILSQWCSVHKINFAWCRLFYLYGEGEHPNRLYPYIISQLKANKTVEMSSGNQIRDFLEIKDAAKKITKIAINDLNGPFNICSGNGISIKEFAENIANKYQKSHLLRFGVREDNHFDPPHVVGVEKFID